MRGVLPTDSSREYPVRASNAGFTYSITPPRSVIITRSADCYRAPKLAHRIFCLLPLAVLAVDVNGITDGASNGGFIQISSLQAVRCARFDGCIYRNLIDMIAKENDRGRAGLPYEFHAGGARPYHRRVC